MTTKHVDNKDQTVLEYSIVFTFVGLIVPLSLVWNIYFVRRILHFNRLHRVCVEMAKSDPFGNYIEAAHQCMAMKIKYIFLQLINITEFSGISTYALGSVLTQKPDSYNHIYSNNQETIPNCTTELIHSKISELRLFYGNPLNSILVSTGQVGLMLSLVFVICLMKYLHAIFHNISHPFHSIRRLLIVSVLVAVTLIITGSVPQLMIVHKLIGPILQFLFLCVWIKHTRIILQNFAMESFRVSSKRQQCRFSEKFYL